MRRHIEQMLPRVKQVIKQTRVRIRGDTRSEGKLVSVFEPSTEVIRKGKAGKPTEFGKMMKLQEAENKIVIDFVVYDRRSNDCYLLSATEIVMPWRAKERPLKCRVWSERSGLRGRVGVWCALRDRRILL
jgi:hypothetical protein